MSAGMKIGLLLSVVAAGGLGYLIYDKLMNKPGTAANAQANTAGEKGKAADPADPSKEPERLGGVEPDESVGKHVADGADEIEEDMFNDVKTASKTPNSESGAHRGMDVDDDMSEELTTRKTGNHPLASSPPRTAAADGMERTASAGTAGSGLSELDDVDMDTNGSQPGRGMSTAAAENSGMDDEGETATDLFETANDDPPVSRKTAATTKPTIKPAAKQTTKPAAGTLRKGSTTIVPVNGRNSTDPDRLGEWEPDPEDKTPAPKTTLITPAESGEFGDVAMNDVTAFDAESTGIEETAFETEEAVVSMSTPNRATSTGSTAIQPAGSDVDLDEEVTIESGNDTVTRTSGGRAMLITEMPSQPASQAAEDEFDIAAGYRERSTDGVASRSTNARDDEMTAGYTKPVSRSTTDDDSAPASEEYVVAPGDNFWAISKKVYGTVRFFRALTKHNETIATEKELRPGMIVSAPTAATLQRKYPDLIEAAPKTVAASGDKVRLTSARMESKSATPTTRLRLPKLEEETATASGRTQLTAGNSAQPEFGYFEAADGTPRVRVGSDDTLSGIALQYLGKASRWTEVFDLNRDVLRDENTLVPGTVLKLPRDAASVAIANSDGGEPH